MATARLGEGRAGQGPVHHLCTVYVYDLYHLMLLLYGLYCTLHWLLQSSTVCAWPQAGSSRLAESTGPSRAPGGSSQPLRAGGAVVGQVEPMAAAP